MRQIIIGILAIAIIAGGIFGARKMISSRKQFQPKPKKVVTPVYTTTVENSNTTLKIRTSGQLVAKNRLRLFSEVQGVFEPTGREFKPGVHYAKGDLLIKINSEEFYATLQSQKSSLYNQIVAVMPDLRLDYPESFPHWDEYVRNFDLQEPVKPLPNPINEKEKLFITGRNLYTAYYNVESQQRRLEKYHIYAPFSGVLTQALVQPGTLVRPGQELGEFIDQSVFEMEAAVNVEYMDILKIGRPVVLRNIRHTKEYRGRVARVNGRVDQSTQTITVFIEVSGQDLKEGLYLEAELEAQEVSDTYELSRKLLLEGDQVYVVHDTTLALVTVNPVHFREESVVVKGLEEGTTLLAQNIPGAYPGMTVKIVDNQRSAFEGDTSENKSNPE
jgi:multidrug efflux pump subunit AcrA (membrane-fusion protein)